MGRKDKMNIAMIIIGMLIILIIFPIGLFINRMSKDYVFFGVRIPIGYEKRPDLLELEKKYKTKFTISTLIFTLLYILAMSISSNYSAFVMLLGMFIYMGIMQWNFYIIFKKVKSIKKSEQWILESKNKIVVDLKYRNKDEKQKLSISLLWYVIPAIIVYFSFVISYETSMVSLAISEAVTTIISIICTKMIVRTKQDLNGGDVNKIRERTKRSRYKLSKAFLVLCITTNLVFLLMIILFKYQIESPVAWVIVYLSLILIMVGIVIYIIKINKEKQSLQEEEQPDSMIINRDDDDNYIMGSIYYNKYDPAVMVEKRVGIGTTFNFARWPAKIFMGITGAILVACLLFMLYIPTSLKESEITFNAENMKIHGMYGTEVKYSDIDSIQIGDKIKGNKVLFRTNGASVDNIKIGKFNIKGLGKGRLFIMNYEKPDIEMKLKDGTYLIINYEDTNKTKALYEKIEDKLNIKK